MNNRYFPSFLKSINSQREVFVDIGAHHGNTLNLFIQKFENKISKFYLFEPDKKNVEKLIESHKELFNKKNFFLYEYALSYKNNKEKFFEGFNYLSKLSKDGQSKKKR